ncbi:hypothetical protein HK098_007417 [Nowakowskiella sp. JEL0407]|nr:hypothetical protein HK098_007417 [Nowakowskiella sp. JEL0407]
MANSIPVATLKLLLIGDSGTGKSSILLRFIDDTWLHPDDVSATIGVDFKVKIMDVDNSKYKLTIWDTAGQERFRTLTSSYYRGAQGVILVYDVSNRESFDHLQQWITELETYASSKDVVMIIVGNKTDKETQRTVSRKEGEAYAKRMGTLFIETSAKTKVGVKDAFEEVVRKFFDHIQTTNSLTPSGYSESFSIKEKHWTIQFRPVFDSTPEKKMEFTPEELAKFDGTDDSKPVYLAIKGVVYDVTSARSMYSATGGYHCFAGKDASRALGKSSLKIEDCTPDYSDFNDEEVWF